MTEEDFNLEVIEAFSIPDAWFQCVRAVLLRGREYVVAKGGSFEGVPRKELDSVVIHITHPSLRPLFVDIPSHLGLPPVASRDSIEKYFITYLFEGDKEQDEDYTYGNRLLGYNEDQVAEAIAKHRRAIVESQEMGKSVRNNQATMEIGHPSDIILESPPCMRLIDTSIVNGVLVFHTYFRSWDLWAGLPTNLGGLQHLKEYMAEEIGVKDGPIVAGSKGLHLYQHTWAIAETAVYKERIAKIDKGVGYSSVTEVELTEVGEQRR